MRRACCRARGATQRVNVELLADIRTAFGDEDVHPVRRPGGQLWWPTRSARGRNGSTASPLTQKQLAGLLRPFGIISETVHPARPSARQGLQAGPIRGGWAAYCPPTLVKTPRAAQMALPKRRSVQMPMKRAHLAIFEASPKESARIEKRRLILQPCGFARLRGSKAGKGRETESDHEERPRPSRLLGACNHCGQPASPADPLNPYDWNGAGVRLHGRCEAPWFDSAAAGQAAE